MCHDLGLEIPPRRRRLRCRGRSGQIRCESRFERRSGSDSEANDSEGPRSTKRLLKEKLSLAPLYLLFMMVVEPLGTLMERMEVKHNYAISLSMRSSASEQRLGSQREKNQRRER